jgi:large repetitive protein
MVPDVIDRCPDEKEDYDGEDDDDGCRDLDPNDDIDGDGIVNIDDDCIDEPEDFDGHNDEDGCPETHEDSDGDGLFDAMDQCPDEAEDFDAFNDGDGCPDPDNDQDQVIDIYDACPLIPEDADWWHDEDGCPDPDNDSDGVPDIVDNCPNQSGVRSKNGCPLVDSDNDSVADGEDQCPDEAETLNNYLDNDGCPDTRPSTIRLTRSKIDLTETIEFAAGKSALLQTSYSVLREVAQLMMDVPDMRVRIEGHTDSQGDEAQNLRLSQARATEVQVFLEQEGIEPLRLYSAGHGESQPIDTNRTPEGRAHNRRVEFIIIKE